MTEKLRQSLSAVVDGEADAFELRRVIDELGRDSAMKGTWDRYHLIGSALRRELPASALDDGMRKRIWAALDYAEDGASADIREMPANEPDQAQLAPRVRHWGRYMGAAVAASVAVAVVLGFNEFDGPNVSGASVADAGLAPAVTAPQPTTANAGASVAPRLRYAADVSPSDVQRAQAYILHHTQQQALNQAGVMSFVKLATYEAP
jgi:sigma-E factor negative regulatory protein RseA